MDILEAKINNNDYIEYDNIQTRIFDCSAKLHCTIGTNDENNTTINYHFNLNDIKQSNYEVGHSNSYYHLIQLKNGLNVKVKTTSLEQTKSMRDFHDAVLKNLI